MNDDLDPRTPVVIGVGQFSERIDRPDYRGLSPVELAAAAAEAALVDSGADPAVVAEALDTVAGVRQTEISLPGLPTTLGRSDNFPRSVADRVGAAPRRAVLEVGGGQSPQHLVNEFAGEIAGGRAEAVLLVGAEATSTTRHLSAAADKPDFSEHVDGDLEDRGYGLSGARSSYAVDHGLTGAPVLYALFENARRARLGSSRAEYARSMGELFAPFTRVAARNPHASAPIERTAAELVVPTEANRLIAYPYTRYVVAREKVNQAAAVLITSITTALALGVPQEKWVFLHGHADLRERNLLDRADLSESPASVSAARHALEMAGVGVDDLATFDFYSCFPIAVFNTAIDGLGLAAEDPRGLTVTGGLPFFGGAGNNYAMHAIAETVQRARTAPGSFGFVGANGGALSKYSAGVYSTRPVPWRADDSTSLQQQIDRLPAPAQVLRANGWATIETYTVTYDRDGSRAGVVVGRLEHDGGRFLAQTCSDDEEVLEMLSSGEPIGQRVFAKWTPRGNRIAVSDVRMSHLYPARVPAFREHYEHLTVRRDGRVLEIVINRPDQRNALHPPANDELDEVFDAFFADPGLWVAILTGAGDKAFCAGNDLRWQARGNRVWVPEGGFGGLTDRPSLPKPVIAAVNGFAMGGGTEIALTCHLVVADVTATFALTEVKVGLIAGMGGLIRLPRMAPTKLANEMILTGRRLGAQEALSHGLVNRIAPAGGALAAARELAAEILAVSPTSVRVSLQVMQETQAIADIRAAVQHRSAAVDELLVSEDMIEGVQAFAEKREPRWRNR
ncbi:acetyl-CoA acetyltransferase [Pseudonocardia sp.]|uniref:acetyl-CoA acetyltransferase n=1 Tax=Pseudonocardia sp. TaxID=60912 RepID=UPI003D09690A